MAWLSRSLAVSTSCTTTARSSPKSLTLALTLALALTPTLTPTLTLTLTLTLYPNPNPNPDPDPDPNPNSNQVLEHLLKRGAAQLVDTVSIEWHTLKRGAGGSGGKGPVRLRARQKRISAALEQLGARVIVWGDARLLGPCVTCPDLP